VLAGLGDRDGAERELGALPDSTERNDPVLADVIRNARALLAQRR
jgi:hypothetical protein